MKNKTSLLLNQVFLISVEMHHDIEVGIYQEINII